VSLLGLHERGARESEIEALASRTPFSGFLPYRAFDPKTLEYINMDNSFGRVWECAPLAFAYERTIESLTGLLRHEHPQGTVIQFMLFPDDAFAGLCEQYIALKTREDDFSRESARRYAQHLFDGRSGLPAMGGIRVRNFRLFVAVKALVPFTDEGVSSVEESLGQAGLAPRPVQPGVLLDFLRRLLNSQSPANSNAYDPHRPLCNQIVQAETVIRHGGDHLRVGSRYAACLTPKSPCSDEYLDVLKVNELIGGFHGPYEDATQLTNKFLWTTTVLFRNVAGTIRKDASIMMMQKFKGRVAQAISRRVDELSWVLADIEREPYVNVLSSVWVFGEDEDDLNRGVARARSLWESQKFVMQRETRILVPMLIAALPFGLYDVKKNIEVINRDLRMSASAAAHMLPVQGDFAGRMRPVQLYTGRKGQIVTLDVFDKRANNHNFLVCAESGAGKSFTLNKLVNDYYGIGSPIRLIDIGYSYQKQCALSRGRYVDIGAEAGRLCLNPFQSAVRANVDAEDRHGDQEAISFILLSMAFSATGVPNNVETIYTLMKDAVVYAQSQDGGLHGVDHVARFLVEYPKHAQDHPYAGADELAHGMGYNLKEFTSKGAFGRLFNGPSTLSISADEFVVLELERIIQHKRLFPVMSLVVINAITQDLYLSDRSRPRFMLFDEAWKYFSVAPMIADMITEGYRRARKYHGATGIITQSPLDLLAFGTAGAVVNSNSAFKFFLQSRDYDTAIAKGVLQAEGLERELLMSVRNVRPRYSEMVAITPFGTGVLRLCPDRFTYWANTTTGNEVAKFHERLAELGDARKAIDSLIEEEARESAAASIAATARKSA
jgi:conjugal transfer ATP-binding protein TraC